MAAAIVLVTGLPAAGKSTLARRLGRALGWPVLSLDSVKEALHAQAPAVDRAVLRRQSETILWVLAADQPSPVFIDLWVQPGRDNLRVRADVSALGVPAAEIVCAVDAETAVARYRARQRDGPHQPADSEVLDRIRAAATAWGPLGVGPTLTVATAQPVDLGPVVDWLQAQLS